MNTSFKTIASFTIVLTFGAVGLSAQSTAASTHASTSVALSGAASGEASAAVGDSAVGSVKVAAGVAAVPIWMSGAPLASIGAASVEGAKALNRGADHMWDFATGEPAKRPALNREIGIPPVKKAPEARAKDPSPAEALKSKA